MTHRGTQTDAGSVAAQAREQAKQQAEQAGGRAKDKLRDQVDQRSTQAGERVGSTAQDVRSVAEELRRQGKDTPAKLAEQAADRAERVGGYLRESDADRILGDIEDFGRSKPWLIALGGLGIGLAAARFLKASSSQRYQQRQGDRGYAARSLPPAPPSAETAPRPIPGSTAGLPV